MNTNVAKPSKVAIIGASGTYGQGILARAEEIGVEAVVVTRSPHKFQDVQVTTGRSRRMDEKEKLKAAFAGCDGVISALGDDRKIVRIPSLSPKPLQAAWVRRRLSAK